MGREGEVDGWMVYCINKISRWRRKICYLSRGRRERLWRERGVGREGEVDGWVVYCINNISRWRRKICYLSRGRRE